MDFSFLEILILVLVGALYFRDIAENYLRKVLGLPLKNGHSDGQQLQINELREHARIANEEMGVIKHDISAIKEDIAFIKGCLAK